MKHTLTSISALLLLSGCGGDPAPKSTPETGAVTQAASQANAEKIAAESARLNAFFETKFEESLTRSPMAQTFRGIKTDYANGMMPAKRTP